MQVDTGEFRALRDQVDGLTARLGQLEQTAFIFKTAEDILDLTYHGGYAQGQADILGRGRRRRPRHLRPIDGGAS